MTLTNKKSTIAIVSVLTLSIAIILVNCFVTFPKDVFATMSPFLFFAFYLVLILLAAFLEKSNERHETEKVFDYHTLYTLTR